MDKWKAVNVNNTDEGYEFSAIDYEEAKHWVINHLDCSKQWCIYNITEEDEK